ncbi:MAG: DedA family protein [Holosporales bacterium]|jgi:membrane protein DedA with SNARE-associated domain|nr:DedA family protein [Holosporales bacterium]
MFDFGVVADFVKEWGYIAVLIGSIFEGEIVLITASASATLGYLSIYKIFLVAFLTTVVTDQVLFLIGYKFGTDWAVNRFPKVKNIRNRIFAMLHKMDVLFILAFRFIYGIRTISPLIIGSARVRPVRFVFFNILSGFCWAFVCCFLGYVIADVVIDGKFDTVPAVLAISGIITVLIAAIALFAKFRQKNRSV